MGVGWRANHSSVIVWTDEEEEDNTEDQDEQGNLRGLIDDGDDEEGEDEEEPQPSRSEAGSDSEEEVRHRRKKRSKFNVFIRLRPLCRVLLQVMINLKKPHSPFSPQPLQCSKSQKKSYALVTVCTFCYCNHWQYV